jgi:hypothetical protein
MEVLVLDGSADKIALSPEGHISILFLDSSAHVIKRAFPSLLTQAACFLCAALLGISPASAQVDQIILQGQVTDPSGATVPGASVSVIGPGGPVRTTITDGQGRFRVNAPTARSYSLRIVSPGFAPFERANIDLAIDRIQIVNTQLEIQPLTCRIEEVVQALQRY